MGIKMADVIKSALFPRSRLNHGTSLVTGATALFQEQGHGQEQKSTGAYENNRNFNKCKYCGNVHRNECIFRKKM